MRSIHGWWGIFLAFAALPAPAAEIWREPTTGMQFVAVPKGCYKMGLPANAFVEEGGLFVERIKSEMPQHEVCVDAFWMARFEVRNAEWRKLMGATAGGAGADDAPVGGVTWDNANQFAQKLTELAGGGAHFRLPTEAEWEYACRAGAAAVTRTPDMSDMNPLAWYSSPYDGHRGARLQELQPVGKKRANAFGLHDMLGNAWEWTQDTYQPDAYARHELYNPVVTVAVDKRVIRGGGLRTDVRMTRCEARSWLPPLERQNTVGLRLVLLR